MCWRRSNDDGPRKFKKKKKKLPLREVNASHTLLIAAAVCFPPFSLAVASITRARALHHEQSATHCPWAIELVQARAFYWVTCHSALRWPRSLLLLLLLLLLPMPPPPAPSIS